MYIILVAAIRTLRYVAPMTTEPRRAYLRPLPCAPARANARPMAGGLFGFVVGRILQTVRLHTGKRDRQTGSVAQHYATGEITCP